MSDDRREIENLVQEYADSCTAGDLERWSEVLASDAIFNAPDLPTMKGKDAIMHWAKEGWFDPLDMRLSAHLDELEVARPWAFGVGRFTVAGTPKAGGDSFTAPGAFLAVYHRAADEGWRYSRFSFNFEAPPEEKA